MARVFRNYIHETVAAETEYVYHAKNTTGYTCNSKSCIDCWKEHAEKSYRKKCYCCGRPAIEFQYDFVGAHVYKWSELAYNADRTLYVVPTCRDCNTESPEDYFTVLKSDLVTCQIAENSRRP